MCCCMFHLCQQLGFCCLWVVSCYASYWCLEQSWAVEKNEIGGNFTCIVSSGEWALSALIVSGLPLFVWHTCGCVLCPPVALCTRTCSPWSRLLSWGWKCYLFSLLASASSFSFFFFFPPHFFEWPISFLPEEWFLPEMLLASNTAVPMKMWSWYGKNNPSPQDGNRSLLVFEPKRSGVRSQVCDIRKQTVRVVTLLWPNTRTVILTLDSTTLCKDTQTAPRKPWRLKGRVRGTWPRCFGTQPGSSPFCGAMAKLIKTTQRCQELVLQRIVLLLIVFH